MRKIILIFVLGLLLTSCSLPGLGTSVRDDGIVVMGGNTSERQILAEVVSQMTRHYIPEASPRLVNNLGSSFIILQAMENEDGNVSSAMYTGTSLIGELGLEPIADEKEALETVVKGYYEKFDMVWFPSYGFENTYAFMVSKEFAESENLTSVSDLERLAPNLRVGVDTSWIDRPGSDGYQGFQEVYGFEFGTILPMEIGLVYDAINSGEMDLVLGYSTDGRVNAYNLVILEDDRKVFPAYDASPVITSELLKNIPQMEEVLLRLEGSIDSDEMQRLNKMSDEEKIEPNEVARRFLVENNYFEDKDIISLEERQLYREIIKEVYNK